MSGLSKLTGVILLGGLVCFFGCQGHRSGVLTNLPGPALHIEAGGTPSRSVSPSQLAVRPPKHSREALTFPASWYPPVRDHAWTAIVVHHSAGENGCAAAFDRMHRQRGWDELGYHFVIGNGTGSADGAVEVGSRWRKQKHGAHCKTASNQYNDHGIGICLVGNFENHVPSPKQTAQLRKLLTFLMQRYNIPPGQVYGHGEVRGTHTSCPGRYMRMTGLRAWLQRNQPIFAGSR